MKIIFAFVIYFTIWALVIYGSSYFNKHVK
jgi:hypothetical protein